MWTKFWDMSSGGGKKLKWGKIWIEADCSRAVELFEYFFGRDPHYITCHCCGPDYDVDEYESLEEATNYERCSIVRERACNEENRHIPWDEEVEPITIEELADLENFLIVTAFEIKQVVE